MKARDVMVRDVLTVKPETDVADAIKLLVEHDISALPVVAPDGRLVGILSEADLRHHRNRHHRGQVEAHYPLRDPRRPRCTCGRLRSATASRRQVR